MTFAQCAQRIEGRLIEVDGFELPNEQAWMLVGAAAGIHSNAARLLQHRELRTEETQFVEEYLATESLVPVPLYTGYCDCGAITVRVTPDTLLPGTETNRFIDLAGELARSYGAQTVVELGTGCGVVTVSLALGLPNCRFVATDISAPTLAVAASNISKYGLEERVALLHGSWGEPLSGTGLAGSVDLVLSNPPYCQEAALPALPSGFRRFAPVVAINGGSDGLAGHSAVIAAALGQLRDGGWLLLQTETRQAPSVAALIASFGGFEQPVLKVGSHGQERFVAAKRRRGGHANE